jgi:hypothetical protein
MNQVRVPNVPQRLNRLQFADGHVRVADGHELQGNGSVLGGFGLPYLCETTASNELFEPKSGQRFGTATKS